MTPLFEKSGKKVRRKRLDYREDQSLVGEEDCLQVVTTRETKPNLVSSKHPWKQSSPSCGWDYWRLKSTEDSPGLQLLGPLTAHEQSLTSEELFWDLHHHYTNPHHTEGSATASWPGLSRLVLPENIWVFDLPVTQTLNKTRELPLGDANTARQAIKKSIVLSCGTLWQLTINQFSTSEMWIIFKVSLDLSPQFSSRHPPELSRKPWNEFKLDIKHHEGYISHWHWCTDIYFGSRVPSGIASLIFHKIWRPYREITLLLSKGISQESNP